MMSRSTVVHGRHVRGAIALAAALAVVATGRRPANAQPAAARSAPAAGGERAALRIADVLGVRTFADRVQVDLDPRGEMVAFTLEDPGRAGELALGARPYFTPSGVPRGHRGTAVWITDVRTGRTRDLTGTAGSAWSPAWSPDGRTLAFYADRGGTTAVWLWDRERDALRRLSGGDDAHLLRVRVDPLVAGRAARAREALPGRDDRRGVRAPPARPGAARGARARRGGRERARVRVARRGCTRFGRVGVRPRAARPRGHRPRALVPERGARRSGADRRAHRRGAAPRAAGAGHGVPLLARRSPRRVQHAPAGRRARDARPRPVRPAPRGRRWRRTACGGDARGAGVRAGLRLLPGRPPPRVRRVGRADGARPRVRRAAATSGARGPLPGARVPRPAVARRRDARRGRERHAVACRGRGGPGHAGGRPRGGGGGWSRWWRTPTPRACAARPCT
jgi:hypothetical protein